MTTIRLFRPDDAVAVAELITRCLREVNSRDYPAELIDRMCAHFNPLRMLELSQQRQIFVAQQATPTPSAPAAPSSGDGLLGAGAGLVGTVSRDGNKVFTMFVHPRAHGQGVGRQLMTHIENLAAADGFDHMETGASITGHGFYQRIGYTDVRVSDTDFGINYILRKPLR
ncbi:GNAT family N-acetyltransferase [Actinoplanes awajinensis]|uniref:GCN5 family acetyltransferase n=1 Tax=Actinoplanes awajinensis subsp. mycoplanecinus TaxID=135947 RepID=A0A101JFY7_9ACTN|nr:GNAT family N-acetyltransferase [Actinoplanes awajinensis]KUL26179.1 GCN5 family acetyltransferase [Actinoplanes awajinensis subsp. mycoplanecinus]